MGTFTPPAKLKTGGSPASRSGVQNPGGYGSEHTWIHETVLDKLGIQREKKDVTFVMANGQVITRSVGFAILRVGRPSPWTRWCLRKRGICCCWAPALWKA